MLTYCPKFFFCFVTFSFILKWMDANSSSSSSWTSIRSIRVCLQKTWVKMFSVFNIFYFLLLKFSIEVRRAKIIWMRNKWVHASFDNHIQLVVWKFLSLVRWNRSMLFWVQVTYFFFQEFEVFSHIFYQIRILCKIFREIYFIFWFIVKFSKDIDYRLILITSSNCTKILYLHHLFPINP